MVNLSFPAERVEVGGLDDGGSARSPEVLQRGRIDCYRGGVVQAASQNRPGRAALVLVITGGMVWIVAAVAYTVLVSSCLTCASSMVAAGVDTSDFSAGAVHVLAWDALYANLYVAVIGVLAVVIALTAFRRGDRWAWFAMAVFAFAGIGTAVLDQFAWGGWYTVFIFGLLPTLGVLIAAPRMLRGQG
jgi:hypothetical protein